MYRFKITVIGTINKDSIIFPNGKRTESFGGIFYNLSALSGLGGKRLEIYPVCNLGCDVYDEVTSTLERFGNVNLRGISKVKRKNNHALLLIDGNNQREEILKNRVPVLRFEQVKPFLDSQVILVNFISGFDIGLTDLKRIRKSTKALIYLDIHSLTLGRDKTGRRYLRMPRNWREYLKAADFVQTNLPELNVLSGGKVKSLKDIRDFGIYVLGLGLRVLLVTIGEKGTVMIYREGEKVKFKRCQGIKFHGFKDATGCGDVFSAGFLTCYFITRNLIQALNFANKMATENCKISGTENVLNLMKKYGV
ncbi:MAG: carbohydrate kinase family protein [Candidatus Zixiibacteriota bacterium]